MSLRNKLAPTVKRAADGLSLASSAAFLFSLWFYHTPRYHAGFNRWGGDGKSPVTILADVVLLLCMGTVGALVLFLTGCLIYRMFRGSFLSGQLLAKFLLAMLLFISAATALLLVDSMNGFKN